MGEPVKIVELAETMIRLSGLPEDGIEMAYSGVRPGEKLTEELAYDEEQTLETDHPKVRAVYQSPFGLDEVRRQFDELESMMDGPEVDLRQRLREMVVDYGRTTEKSLVNSAISQATSVS